MDLDDEGIEEVEEPNRRRIALTVSCHDADAIPKVPDAGEVVVENDVRVQIMHDGTRVLAGAYHGAWMSEIIRRLRGHHEPQEELVVHRILQRLADDPVVVELGSFWAYYAIWALRARGGRCLLVEPDPRNLEVGRANLRLNGLPGEVVQAAIGGRHGSMTRLTCESDGIERTLPVVTVPGLMHDHDLERIDLLFADVQGAETDLVERMVDALQARRVRFLVLSTHHHSISGDPLTHERCLRSLAQAGVHVIASHTVAESFSGDGLIAASTDPRDVGLVVEVSRCPAGLGLFAT